jgi:hypothetical protein
MSTPKLIDKAHAANGAACDEVRDNWVASVNDLAHDVESWAREHGWEITQTPHEQKELRVGTYTIPYMEIDGPDGKVMLEPIARYHPDADGRVDLFAWPSHYRVQLLRKEGQGWFIKTDSGLNWPFPWGKDTFLSVAEELMKA